MNKKEYLSIIDEVISKGPYRDDWESLCEHETPKWYVRDKFGIFIHWGIYSVPAHGSEWYVRNLYRKNSMTYKFHTEKYGPVEKFGYKDLIPLFKAEKWDPDEWAEIFKESGARFVMPVAEHHDGFQMYDSDLSIWNSKNMGPKRDILGELKVAVEKKGMKICASSHRAEHWWFCNHGRNMECDVNDPKYQDFYGPAHGPSLSPQTLYDNPPDKEFLEDWLVRTCEIVDKYNPYIMYFDWWICNDAFKPYLKKFAAYYYNRGIEWGKEVTINAKWDAFMYGSVNLDIERGNLSTISPRFWQCDTAMKNGSWCYTEVANFKSASEVLFVLADAVSKNGALLLNVGPKADGTICSQERKILKEIGEWLSINGEAIYGTHPWKVFSDGDNGENASSIVSDKEGLNIKDGEVRFTMKGEYLYAIIFNKPNGGNIKLKQLAQWSEIFRTDIVEMEILGRDIAIPHGRRYEYMNFSLPVATTNGMPVVVKMKVR